MTARSTDSPVAVGLVFLAATLPNLVLGPIAGTFVDRLNQKQVMVVSDLLRAAGYPPEAVVNMLGLVASSGPGEVLDMDGLVARFDPDRIARGDVRLDLAQFGFAREKC